MKEHISTMRKISNVLEDITRILEKKAFIPNPSINDPNQNPKLAQAYQQLQQIAQSLPPQAQQQLQQQVQQLQQMPEEQQLQALGQLTQQVQQAAQQPQGQQPGDPSVPPGQDPNAQGGQGQPGQDPSQQGGQPGQDPNAQGQPTSGGGNDPGASQLSALDQQTITLTLADLLNLVTKGDHSKTTAKIKGSAQDAQLQSQMLAMKHQEKLQDLQKKQQEKQMQEAQQQQLAQQQQQMAAQQSSPSNIGGGGIYPQAMGQPAQGQPQQ